MMFIKDVSELRTNADWLSDVTDLTIRDKPITDLSALKALTQLQRLRILDCDTDELSPLLALTNLDLLVLRSTKPLGVTEFRDLKNLVSLELTAPQVSGWPALLNLPNLRNLALVVSTLGSPSPFRSASQLRSFHLASDDLVDLSFLSEMSALIYLVIESKQALNIGSLQSLPNLNRLVLQSPSIDDLSPMARMKELSSLVINAKTPSLEALSNLTKLKFLDIKHTGARDLSPLARLVGLMVGTLANPTSGGLLFDSKMVSDPFIRNIGRLGRVERVRRVLEYLRRRAGLSTLSEAMLEWRHDTSFEANWQSIAERIQPSPHGAKFVASNDQLVIDPAGDESDEIASGDPTTRQLHEGVKRRAAAFSTMAVRLDNQPGWRGIGAVARRYSEAVDRPTDKIPSVIGHVYEALIELGSFLEFDSRIRAVSDDNASPLDLEVQRAFVDLVRGSAPWVRRFPTARHLDEEIGAFLTDRSLYDPSKGLATTASAVRLITNKDAEAIQLLLEAATRGEVQSRKAGNRGAATARNLAVSALGIASAFYVGALSSDYATKSALIQRAGSFLVQGEQDLLRLFANLPADIGQALRLMLEDLKK